MISLKVPEELKEKMKRFTYINWSEIARRAIIERIEIEERVANDKVNLNLLNEAIGIQDTIRNKTKKTKDWSSTEEIRKWRETRK